MICTCRDTQGLFESYILFRLSAHSCLSVSSLRWGGRKNAFHLSRYPATAGDVLQYFVDYRQIEINPPFAIFPSTYIIASELMPRYIGYKNTLTFAYIPIIGRAINTSNSELVKIPRLAVVPARVYITPRGITVCSLPISRGYFESQSAIGRQQSIHFASVPFISYCFRRHDRRFDDDSFTSVDYF